MAEFDKQRIDALLADLRSLDPDDPTSFPSVDELARKHQLDPMVVRRIAQAEDIDLKNGDAVPEAVDDEAPTGPIDV